MFYLFRSGDFWYLYIGEIINVYLFFGFLKVCKVRIIKVGLICNTYKSNLERMRYSKGYCI